MKLAATLLRQMPPTKLSASFEGELFKRFWTIAVIFRAQYAHLLIATLGIGLLPGCSGMRIVDSQVAAFSKIEAPLAAGSSWRFERLPSQQNLEEMAAARRNKFEAMAELELAKLGFQAKPQPLTSSAVAYTVQLAARIQRLDRGPFDPIDAWGWSLPGRDYVVTGAGRVIYTPIFPRVEMPWYVREVSLLIRDTKDNRAIFETQARHEGRWADDEAVLPAMIAAALQGFPKPPDGKRMVNIEIAR